MEKYIVKITPKKKEQGKDQERKLHQEENSKQRDFHMLIL